MVKYADIARHQASATCADTRRLHDCSTFRAQDADGDAPTPLPNAANSVEINQLEKLNLIDGGGRIATQSVSSQHAISGRNQLIAADLDVALMLPRFCQVMRELHAQPHLRRTSECL